MTNPHAPGSPDWEIFEDKAVAAEIDWQARYEKCVSDQAIKSERFRRTRARIEYERDQAYINRDVVLAELRALRESTGLRIAELERERDHQRNVSIGSSQRLRELEAENGRLQTIERDMRASVIKELSEKLFS